MAERNGKPHLFSELEQKAYASVTRFKVAFDDELSRNEGFYTVASVSELTEKMHIKEFDYRTEIGILRLLEGLAPGKFEYMLDNFWDVVSGLQKDINRLTREFNKVAYEEYGKCVLEFENLVKNIFVE